MIKLIIDDNETKRCSVRLNDISVKGKDLPFSKMCVIYTSFDGLIYNKRGYFASCVVFLRARRGDEKFEQ